MTKLFLVLAVSAAWLSAADPAGFAQWKSAELKSYDDKLAAKVDAQKFAAQPLANYGNHTLAVTHREASGVAELHETQADVFIVQSGEATLIVGGTIVNPRTATPHEVRGPSIQGGVSKQLGPGDIVHIAANTPHQLMIPEGGKFTYAVVKVDSR